MRVASVTLNDVLKDFSLLPLPDKKYVIEIMEKQLIEAKRDDIARRAKRAIKNFKKGASKKGTTEDLYKDIELD